MKKVFGIGHFLYGNGHHFKFGKYILNLSYTLLNVKYFISTKILTQKFVQYPNGYYFCKT